MPQALPRGGYGSLADCQGIPATPTQQQSAGLPAWHTAVNQSAIQLVGRCQGAETSQNLHYHVPDGYDPMQSVSMGSPITAHPFSCSATPNASACNFSGCHSWPCVVPGVLPIAGLIPSCRLKGTPERVKNLKLDKERLQARVAELEARAARLARHAETNTDKIALLESQLSLQTQ